jgi:hypothetical protein
MITFILALILGMFIGWHVPEPSWAKRWWQKLKDVVANNFGNKD